MALPLLPTATLCAVFPSIILSSWHHAQWPDDIGIVTNATILRLVLQTMATSLRARLTWRWHGVEHILGSDLGVGSWCDLLDADLAVKS